jgi:hypothetical protein
MIEGAYSLRYRAKDFKIWEDAVAFDGTVISTQITKINFAPLAAAIQDPDMSRLIPEKMAQEYAAKLNEIFMKGWDYSALANTSQWAEA